MAIKRKAVTRDAPETNEPALSDGGLAISTDAAFSPSGSDSYGESDAHVNGELDSSSEDGGASSSHEEDFKADESATESAAANYTVTTDANGNLRYIYQEIDPVYDSDDTDAQEATNAIGNIALSFYDSYPHIGYDVNGKKIARPAAGAALDALLDTIELPPGWTGLTDPATGKALELTPSELELIRRIQRHEYPNADFDPYPPTIEYFTGRTEPMPLSSAPEPKRRFVPSKHEAKRVAKLVRAIRQGRILPHKPPADEEGEDADVPRYDIWANEAPRPDHPMHLPAPKLPPPGYDESYHPPPENLTDAK